jgi:hypothetical protein
MENGRYACFDRRAQPWLPAGEATGRLAAEPTAIHMAGSGADLLVVLVPALRVRMRGWLSGGGPA